MKSVKGALAFKMASPSSSRQSSLCESPVPASMFSPEPGAEDSDCSLDGELLTNGEAELDLTCKHVLVSPNAEQYDGLLHQLRDRMDEGRGETIYVIGQGSDGTDYGLNEADMDASIATITSMAEQIGADMILLREHQEAGGKVRDYLVRKRVGDNDFLEVRVAVVGNVDAGKSTLLGVLTHGELDNGRGFARQKLFRHKHEIESGRTSSVGNDILGFDNHGQVVNKPDNHGGSLEWTKICEKSSKIITFIDLAGHEKYLKTTVFGMTGHLPDFCMLMVGSNAGIVGMTKEHLGLALALNVPVFVVVTKIDMCPANILQETLKLLQRLLKSPGCRKIPVLVQNKDDVIVTASNFSSERMCPIFQISNVTGENLELLKMFLNLLSPRSSSREEEPAEFQIDDTYSVPVSGQCAVSRIKRDRALASQQAACYVFGGLGMGWCPWAFLGRRFSFGKDVWSAFPTPVLSLFPSWSSVTICSHTPVLLASPPHSSLDWLPADTLKF
ncbi:hypothetical protein FKM82_004586 [Ascaphus truei]